MSFILTSQVPSVDPPLTLPSPPAERKKSALPLAAAFVPMLGGVGMFLLTKSPIALMFAAMGPVMMLASLLDGARGRRADARRYRKEIGVAVTHAMNAIDRNHDAQRQLRWRTHPDVATLSAADDEIWRAHPQREATFVVGSGTVATDVDVATGVDGEEAQKLRTYAGALTRAPLVLPLQGGICIRAEPIIGLAVVRALVAQVCSTHGPDTLRVVLGESAEDWMTQLPHVRSSTAERVLMVASPEGAHAETSISWCLPHETPPSGCRTVLDLDSRAHGVLVRDSMECAVQAEAISRGQAHAIANHLAGRAADSKTVEPTVHFSELVQRKGLARRELPVVIGRAGSAPVELDIVTDGPHAVVVGTTGSGKSELLVSWALALCATYTPQEVTLLLADFKGGTAFEPMKDVAHVTGILTDLNESLAKRAMLSLRAEIRRREGAIASVGARDITDDRVALPRLVIIIDEFAALVRQLPELDVVMTDIAARGRALGMHLIIGAQRAAGAIRDATLANTPLRIALRVTDASDSRAIIGTDGAALISGGTEGKGVAFVRRAADATPQRIRCALSAPSDIVPLPLRSAATQSWWDPLPLRVAVHELPTPDRGIAVGIADDTENLRRVPVVIEPGVERGWWVMGGSRTGKTSLVDLIESRHRDAVRVPYDLESAWDCLLALETSSPSLVLWDDVDTALASWPEPWNREAGDRLERLVRAAGPRNQTWVLSAQRQSGALSRIADLLPGRVLFAVPSKLDHVAAGGGSQDHDPARPPGRALMAGVDVQFAALSEPLLTVERDAAPVFSPDRRAIGVVARGAQQYSSEIARSWGGTFDTVSLGAHAPTSSLSSSTNTVVFGDPDQWQRAYATLEQVKASGTLLISADCAPDVRLLTGDRTLAPYAAPGRWWAFEPGTAMRRVRL